MPQSDQFPADLHAPPDWVRQVEGATIASARWRDGSYGNDAAPSWVLVDDSEVVHAQAFYYTSANAERFEKRFGADSYVSVSIIRDDEVIGSCSVTPEAFAIAVSAAPAVGNLSPTEALRIALDAVSAAPLSWWVPATG